MARNHPDIPGMVEEFDREPMSDQLEKERRIQTALMRLHESYPVYSIRQAVNDYSISYSTLRGRFLGNRQPRATAFQHLQRLTPAQERALVRHIKDQDDYGYAATRAVLLEMATALLPDHDNAPLGANWYEGFEDRNPDIKPILSAALDRQRAMSNSQSGYELYWENLHSISIKYGIPPENIWNFDEKGFIIGRCGRYIIYVRFERQDPGKLPQNGNRTTITDGETISAAGKSIPPYIITKGKIHTVGKFQYVTKGILDGASFANAPEGVMHALLSIDYLRDHFEPLTRPFMRTAAQGGSDHRLLLWDNHASHTTLEARYFGVEKQIHLCTYPGHQTHKLQPLDVGVFSPLANAYRILLEKWTSRNLYAAMSQAEFFFLLSEARKVALTEENIKSAFKATGIYPLSREKIMEKLDHTRLEDQSAARNPLLDTPIQNRTISNADQTRHPTRRPRAAEFSTPIPLRRYAAPPVLTPGNPFDVQGLEQRAKKPDCTHDELRAIVGKLGKAAGRGMADSKLQRRLNEGLHEERQRKSEKKDTHHLSQSTVLTQEAAIFLEKERRAKIEKKSVRQRRNKEKKEALRKDMTFDDYILWYNTEKARRPVEILRTQLNIDTGELENIPMPISDDEWQRPTPQPSPKLRPSQTRTESSDITKGQGSDLVLDEADLQLLFGDLHVTSSVPDPTHRHSHHTNPKSRQKRVESVEKRPIEEVSSVSRKGGVAPLFNGPAKKLSRYIPVPIPSTLQPVANSPPLSEDTVSGVGLGVRSSVRRLRSKRGEVTDVEDTEVVAREVEVGTGQEAEDVQQRKLVVNLKVSGDKLDRIWRPKRRSMRRK